MKIFKYTCLCGALLCILSSFMFSSDHQSSLVFPYRKAGLTERQAAAHLISRFTYGATPGKVDAVIKTGLEKWFLQQLDGDLPDDSLNHLLGQFDALQLSNAEVAKIYLKGNVVRKMAINDGVISKDSVKTAGKAYKAALENYAQQKGYRPEQELLRQFFSQKILRAAYSNNQLREVMTDFWFNHFNVSIAKNDCISFMPAYERDVIRPRAVGNFGDLLLATAQSPAMLYYLDNFKSTGNTMQPSANKKKQGLNENYAREVMELHTLGVDGGYTQQDVTQAARVLTGWTVYPIMPDKQPVLKRGAVHNGDFLFLPARHDSGEKIVLGKKFGPNGGYQEGVDLLQLLAHHQATARFITKKLAVRFVNDIPPQSLLDKMAESFTAHNGNIKAVLLTMVVSPEFWSQSSLREKIKSPFELVMSSVRGLNAQISQPYQLYSWANKMGQHLYAYQAPTGFPDRSQYWINTGALLVRMNFGLALATQRIPGVEVNLPALNHYHEPESPQAALQTYSKLIMPERNLDQTMKYLSPMLNDPDLIDKVDRAAAKGQSKNNSQQMQANAGSKKEKVKGLKKGLTDNQMQQGDNLMLNQVVGIIIGSPEFQRR